MNHKHYPLGLKVGLWAAAMAAVVALGLFVDQAVTTPNPTSNYCQVSGHQLVFQGDGFGHCGSTPPPVTPPPPAAPPPVTVPDSQPPTLTEPSAPEAEPKAALCKRPKYDRPSALPDAGSGGLAHKEAD